MIRRRISNRWDIITWILEDLDPRNFEPASGSRISWLPRLIWRLAHFCKLCKIASDEIMLLNQGFQAESEVQINLEQKKQKKVELKSIYYLAFVSLPFHSSGYAARTHGLVAGLRQTGIDAKVLTRIYYPENFLSFKHASTCNEIINRVPYQRLSGNLKAPGWISTREYLSENIMATVEASRAFRPKIIHGASNFIVGLTAVHAAHRLGVKCVYEVRGLWEFTQLSRDPSYKNTLHYSQSVRLETDACLYSDKVITLTNALKKELMRRGVPESKISVVPNGVDTQRFQPRHRNVKLAKQFGIKETDIVIGYIGSIVDYEGLDDLLVATRICVDNGLSNIRLLFVGDGSALTYIKSVANKLKIKELTVFASRVPHEKVEEFYSIVDIFPFPRKPLPVCEMVAPLKIFEAMAMAKCVIVSSVAALAEIIDGRPIGFVYEKGDINSLANKLRVALLDKKLRDNVGSNARKFVVAERDWSILAQQVAKIYDELE